MGILCCHVVETGSDTELSYDGVGTAGYPDRPRDLTSLE